MVLWSSGNQTAHLGGYICRLTSSWCRRPDRWGTCHTWPHRPPAVCTHKPRRHIGPSHCTADPGWTCRYRCVGSSYSSPPASQGHTGRNHSHKRRDLRRKAAWASLYKLTCGAVASVSLHVYSSLWTVNTLPVVDSYFNDLSLEIQQTRATS